MRIRGTLKESDISRDEVAINVNENNIDNPSEGGNNPRRHTSWLWLRVCLAQE